MSSKFILLQGGTVLTHDTHNHVHPILADILIEGNVIRQIGKDIKSPEGAEIIDCTDKILSPGFIDTHHHVWQTLLKGRHANQTILEYMPTGNMTASIHEPADIFWGQLGGALECLDVGTTTVVDFAHSNYSPEHANATVAATISSGIRSVYCYFPTLRVDSWNPVVMNQDLLASWVMSELESLALKAPFADGRVQLGFAFDGFFLPKEMVVPLFEKVKSLGIKTITVHSGRGAVLGQHSLAELLQSYGLLDSILFAHFNNPTPNCGKLLLESNSHVSSTPSTELQMGFGHPVALNPSLNLDSNCSLGIDCHSNSSASIVSEMRLLLQHSRGTYNQPFVDVGKQPRKVNKTAEEAFNLGTINGARAIGMQDKIGTLAVGKYADILVFDALSTSMVAAAQHDPVAAIVIHSSPADIEMAIVDGVVRKRYWMLEPVDLKAGKAFWDVKVEKDVLQWKEIARELVGRRRKLQKTAEGLDYKEAAGVLIKGWHIDESLLVENI